MKTPVFLLLVILSVVYKGTRVESWVTSPGENILFARQPETRFGNKVDGLPVITINPEKRYQSVEGFGNCLTGGSATLISSMDPRNRKELLNELFSTENSGIGISCLRISIGASDLSDHVFSYDDMPDGQTDPELRHFSIDIEKKDLIPVLKEILAINPGINILGSPWSAPVWMKTNGSSKGGSLKPEFYDAYARYFVRYIKAMQAEGITVDAITIQNEPLHPGNNPSMFMPAEEQAAFIRKSLGPAFREAGLKTRIIVYDHNCDKPEYPMTIYRDREAAAYVDGAAFHLYGGRIEALSTVHDSFPEKNLYFTEQWIGGPGNLAGDLQWHTKNLVIGATRNWSRSVLEWNLASDPSYDPHTPGGCTRCLGTVTVDGDKFTRNPAYYILAHCAKFVRPGSVRIDSDIPEGLPNVAFLSPEGKTVLIVLNDSGAALRFSVAAGKRKFQAILGKGAVGTYTWE